MKRRENEESLIWNVVWRISQLPRVEQPYFWPREAGDELGGFHRFRGCKRSRAIYRENEKDQDQHCLILNVST